MSILTKQYESQIFASQFEKKKRKTIIGVVTHNDQGGAQEALLRLFDKLSERGHDVSLIYLYKMRHIEKCHIPTRFVIEKEKPGGIDYLTVVARLFLIFMRLRPMAVISFLPLANIVAQTLAWICQVPVRIASQRNPVQTYSRSMQLLDWYFGTSGSYTHNIVNSSEVELSVAGYPWPYRYRTQVIQNGVETASLCKCSRETARARFGLFPDDVALTSIGRLAKQKNQMLLVQILGALRNFKLLLAGSGPELSRLSLEAERMGVADRILFLGPLDQTDTSLLLHASDIFALPSLYEGHSNALLEAMAAGKAAVTSDIPSHRETLLDGEVLAGVAVPITDPDQWIAKLRELGDSPEKRKELGQNARIRVQSFSIDKMCTEFERAINSR